MKNANLVKGSERKLWIERIATFFPIPESKFSPKFVRTNTSSIKLVGKHAVQFKIDGAPFVAQLDRDGNIGSIKEREAVLKVVGEKEYKQLPLKTVKSKREAKVQEDAISTMMTWRTMAAKCSHPKFRVEVTRWTGNGMTRNSVYCFETKPNAELCYKWWENRGGVTFLELAKYEQLMSLIAKYAEPDYQPKSK